MSQLKSSKRVTQSLTTLSAQSPCRGVPSPCSSVLGLAAVSYIVIDYLRHLSPSWHVCLKPVVLTCLALLVIIRAPFYKHWSAELRMLSSFLASMVFMLASLLFEALCVHSVTAVLGLDWHHNAHPLPDPGQWLLLALVEKLPLLVTHVLRASIVDIHHYLMLFIMLAFSVSYDFVKSPGLGLGARYMFTMAVGRLLRAVSFSLTIYPSLRPWCASYRFYRVPRHPHHCAQKYYSPYLTGSGVRKIIARDEVYPEKAEYIVDDRPDWGIYSFLVDFLHPSASQRQGPTWYTLVKKVTEGGCNDLLFSGHTFVAVLTATAWADAYGGFTSVVLWLPVAHTAQKAVRERQHYTVDCAVAMYVIFLWRMTGFLWRPNKDDGGRDRKHCKQLEKIEAILIQAAKDSDMDHVKELRKKLN